MSLPSLTSHKQITIIRNGGDVLKKGRLCPAVLHLFATAPAINRQGFPDDGTRSEGCVGHGDAVGYGEGSLAMERGALVMGRGGVGHLERSSVMGRGALVMGREVLIMGREVLIIARGCR